MLTRTRKSKEKSRSEALVINGWQLFAHPLLLGQLGRLIDAVEQEARRNPKAFKKGANAKLLAAVSRYMFETIPDDPAKAEYRQGNALGPGRKHWFRAKFGRQRFRLFFRYRSDPKIIVYAWVNDADTLRTRGAKTDAYAVFSSMLSKGSPPDDWDALLEACQDDSARTSMQALQGYVRSFRR